MSWSLPEADFWGIGEFHMSGFGVYQALAKKFVVRMTNIG
jgi:hypothetical protein